MQFRVKKGIPSDTNSFSVGNICRWLLISGLLLYLLFMLFLSPGKSLWSTERSNHLTVDFDPTTNLSHLVFGLLGSEAAWHHRRAYIESWWRPNATMGYLYLDREPTGELLPWSPASPSYRVSDDISNLLEETKAVAPVMIRMVHGIMEVFREFEGKNGDFRWLVMGDDDSIFFVDNMVDVLGRYDHKKYYYFGGQSEFIMSNYWFSFNQGFGGAGFILSWPLAKALARDMESCLRGYAQFKSADHITMMCIVDAGVNFTPLKGIHQIDLHGDISGLLSSHPQAPLLSLHHFDVIDPIFPTMDRFQSTRHLMKAAALDQSRMLQQTICHHPQTNWSFSVSWGYSIHIYESIIPRSHLQKPIETFQPWFEVSGRGPPSYMFNTRVGVASDPCEAPHVFYFKDIKKVLSDGGDYVKTLYYRGAPRGLPACVESGNRSAEVLSTVEVLSPATKRVEDGRCECCDIVRKEGMKKARVKIRQCKVDEIIA